ncbi:MAG TPA: fructosamine kinase family protein [Alphaproteobacteria bacterium]|nr:fructosamine kinase family protein [Alphaproteobacteria bacterium]
MISPAIYSEVEQALGLHITAVAPLSAANNAQIYRLVFATGEVRVAKVAERGLDTEAWMLKYLREKSPLPVPEVFYSNEHVIIMEFVQSQGMVDYRVESAAAEQIAALHAVTHDSYGMERDTLVGSLTQPGGWEKDWPSFFAEKRLMHMAHRALKENKIDARMLTQIEKIAAKLPAMLQGGQAPSLVHGDIWSGNIIPGRGKIAAFLDPAIYYADAEVELAFIRLFNTFSDSFFAKYNEIRPIRAGFFEERAEVYALYPLLVHTRLFGASYARKAQKILDKFA